MRGPGGAQHQPRARGCGGAAEGDARLLDVLDRCGQAEIGQLDAALLLVVSIVAARVSVRLVLAEGLARVVVVTRLVLDLGLELLVVLASSILLTLWIFSILLLLLLFLLFLLLLPLLVPAVAIRALPLALVLLFLELARVLQFLITRARGIRATVTACAERGGAGGRLPRRVLPAQDVLVPAVHASCSASLGSCPARTSPRKRIGTLGVAILKVAETTTSKRC